MSRFGDLATTAPQQIWDQIVARSVNGERITMAVEERRELGPGGTWQIPPNAPHEATAGPEGAVVIDVFAPVRDDWGGIESLERAPRWP